TTTRTSCGAWSRRRVAAVAGRAAPTPLPRTLTAPPERPRVRRRTRRTRPRTTPAPEPGRQASGSEPAVAVQALEEQVHAGEVEDHRAEADDDEPRRTTP